MAFNNTEQWGFCPPPFFQILTNTRNNSHFYHHSSDSHEGTKLIKNALTE